MKKYIYLNSNNEVIAISYRRELISDAVEVVVLLEIMEEVDESYLEREDFLMKVLRAQRDKLMNDTMWIYQRQNTSSNSPISAGDYANWINYWQALRDLPDTVSLTGKTLVDISGLFPTQPTV